MFLLNTYFVKLECDKVPVYNLMLIHKSHTQHKKVESPETIQLLQWHLHRHKGTEEFTNLLHGFWEGGGFISENLGDWVWGCMTDSDPWNKLTNGNDHYNANSLQQYFGVLTLFIICNRWRFGPSDCWKGIKFAQRAWHLKLAFPTLGVAFGILRLIWLNQVHTASMMPCNEGLSAATVRMMRLFQSNFGMSKPWKLFGGTWICSTEQRVSLAIGSKRNVTG